MFIIDSIDSESAWQAWLLHTELSFVVEVDDDVGVGVGDDVGVGVGEEIVLHVSLLKVLPEELKAKQNL